MICPHGDRFTIRGQCAECAPHLHRDHEEHMARYARARHAFMIETECDPLRDYEAFDAWVKRHPDYGP